MSHTLDDNTAEWDARVQREQQRKTRFARRAPIVVSAGVLLSLVALAPSLTLRPENLSAVAAPTPAPAKAAEPAHLGIPLDVSFKFKPESDQLEGQAQSLAVGLARIWRSGKSEEAAEVAHSRTVEYEHVAGCDLRWIAGRAGPGVWEGTLSLVRSLREITPYVGQHVEGWPWWSRQSPVHVNAKPVGDGEATRKGRWLARQIPSGRLRVEHSDPSETLTHT
jgi:hypothetical protein